MKSCGSGRILNKDGGGNRKYRSHLSVFDLSEAVLEPGLLAVHAVPPQRLGLDPPPARRRSASRPGGGGGLQGGTESRNLEPRRGPGSETGSPGA